MHDALRLVSLHRWAFFVPFCLATSTAFIVSLYYPRTYRATTTFERRDDPVMMNLPLSTFTAAVQFLRTTMVRDISSVECVQEAVEDLGLAAGGEPDAGDDSTLEARPSRRLAQSLAAALDVSVESPGEHLDVIRITYTGPDPAIGPQLVKAVKQTSLRRAAHHIRAFLSGQQEFFRREAEEALAAVKRHQREETQLQMESPYVDPDNPGTVATQLAQLEMERRELDLRRQDCQAEIAELEKLLQGTETGGHGQSVEPAAASTAVIGSHASVLHQQIHELDENIADLKATRGMTDLHPEIQALLKRKRALSGALSEEPDAEDRVAVTNEPLGFGPDAGGAAAERGSKKLPQASANASLFTASHHQPTELLAEIATQRGALRDLDISLQTNELALRRLQEAKQEVFEKQEQFAEIRGKVSRARKRFDQVQEALASIEPAIKAIEQGRLLQFSDGQPAHGSSLPISPKASSILLLALLAGLGSGVACVVLAEILDGVYRSSGQVARSLGLPLLECIDEIVTTRDRRTLFLRKTVLAPLVVGCFGGLATLAAAMAYLSLEKPWTYQKIRRLPEAAIQLFVDV